MPAQSAPRNQGTPQAVLLPRPRAAARAYRQVREAGTGGTRLRVGPPRGTEPRRRVLPALVRGPAPGARMALGRGTG
jgi:hypothetical protein